MVSFVFSCFELAVPCLHLLAHFPLTVGPPADPPCTAAPTGRYRIHVTLEDIQQDADLRCLLVDMLQASVSKSAVSVNDSCGLESELHVRGLVPVCSANCPLFSSKDCTF